MAFSEKVVSTLNQMYQDGMKGVGEQYGSMIDATCQQTNLSVKQVQDWIKRKNFHLKHRKSKEIHFVQKRRITPWQQHLQNLSKEKDTSITDLASFNKEAKATYSQLSVAEKNDLAEQALSNESKVPMSTRRIKKIASNIFEQMKKQLKKLEDLGYQAFVFGVTGDSVEIECTEGLSGCFREEVIAYLHALVTSANPPKLKQSNSEDDTNVTKDNAEPIPSALPSISSPVSSANSSHVNEPTSNTVATMTNNDLSSNVSEFMTAAPSLFNDESSAVSVFESNIPIHHEEEHISTTSVGSRSTYTSTVESGIIQSPSVEPDKRNKRKRRRVEVKEKGVPNIWIEELQLDMQDKMILSSSHQWLNYKIINAALIILKASAPQLDGFQSTLHIFQPTKGKFVQIVHIDSNHWIAVSDVFTNNRNEVVLYDSRYRGLTLNTKLLICQLLQNRDVDDIQFLVTNMQQQQDTCSCGLFAIAAATDIVHNIDPVTSRWKVRYLRDHLHQSLEAKTINCFPKLSDARDLSDSRAYLTTVREKLYCKCRQTINPKRRMVLCNTCKKWYHKDCMDLDDRLSYDHWDCALCI